MKASDVIAYFPKLCKWQGNLFSACVYIEVTSLSLLEVISDIMLERGLFLITCDPNAAFSCRNSPGLQLSVWEVGNMLLNMQHSNVRKPDSDQKSRNSSNVMKSIFKNCVLGEYPMYM